LLCVGTSFGDEPADLAQRRENNWSTIALYALVMRPRIIPCSCRA
jgi:hypothetical protein